jgi:modulator of FtsH protease
MGLVASTAALFALGGFGAFGYATRRDLSAIARFCFWALIAPIVFGAVIRSLPPEGARHE